MTTYEHNDEKHRENTSGEARQRRGNGAGGTTGPAEERGDARFSGPGREPEARIVRRRRQLRGCRRSRYRGEYRRATTDGAGPLEGVPATSSVVPFPSRDER